MTMVEQPPQTGNNGASRPLPRNLEAEKAVLGLCLLNNPNITAEIRRRLPTTDPFHLTIHGELWRILTGLHDEHRPTDPITVANRARARATGWNDTEHGPYLSTLYGNAPTPFPAIIAEHANIVAVEAVKRRIVETGARFQTQASNGHDPYALLTAAHDEIGRLLATNTTGNTTATELDEFLHENDDEETYDWVVPQLIERGDRVILTGREGGGKSTLLRQVAMQLAAGIHPFTLDDINPIRVLFVDLENSERQSKRKLRPMRAAAGDHYQDGRMLIKCRPEGIDLHSPDDVRWLTDLVADAKPDILITGPIYKLSSGDPNLEETAKGVTQILDRIRVEHSCALLLEAHSPFGAGAKRPERPYGASLWVRWPEFGIFLDPNGFVRHWRGARDEREWPTALKRGGEWPWTLVVNQKELTWARIVEKCTGTLQLPPTERQLADMIGVSQPTVHRAINEHREEWTRLFATESDE